MTLATAGQDPSAPLVRWTFGQDPQGWTAAHDCQVAAQDGLLVIEASGREPYIHGPRVDIPGPVAVRLRMRGPGEGKGRLYWTVMQPSLVSSAWGEDAVVYFDLARDGQWHEYTLPVDADGTITQLRIDPAKCPGRTEIEWIEVVPPALADGSLPAGNPAMPERLQITGGGLTVDLDCRAHRFVVTDARTGRCWRSGGVPAVRLLDARQASPQALDLSLGLRGSGLVLSCRVTAEDEAALSFALEAAADGALDQVAYPPRLEADVGHGALVFCNRSCGQLIDQTDSKYPVSSLFCYGNLGLDMPWLGVTDLDRGDGLMLLLETPADVAVDLRADAAGRRWPQARWVGAMGRWGYGRRASYRFTESGGYVALAKLYRRHLLGTDHWKTLAEKAKERPNVARLKGAPDVWGVSSRTDGPTALPFALEARACGLIRGIINGNGKFPPADMARINAMGFLTGEYDNYDDIRDGPLGPNSDSIERVALRGRDSRPATGWVTLEGVTYSRRASSHALEAARHLIPPILAEYPFTARFLDVTTTVDLVEDYHPERPADRRQDLANRLDLLRYVRGLGLVLGGEHGKAWNAAEVDYAEGTMSGPFWWEMPAGHLVVPKSRDEIKPHYTRYGIDPAARIPLWELVFHECLVTTWYWGDSSGYYIDTAPELSDWKDLANLLYGTVPLLWVDHRGYGWNRHRERFLETCRVTGKWHEAVGFEEMLSHEFLSQDRRVQRTRFGNGATAVVNFADEPRPYRGGWFDRVTLAPRGFWARGPGIEQSRVMEDGAVVTRIRSPGFHLLQSPTRRRDGALEVAGRLAVYALEAGLWGCTVESAEPCSVDLGRLVGRRAAAGCRVYPVGALGERGPELSGVVEGDTLRLPGGPGLRVFAIELPPDPRHSPR